MSLNSAAQKMQIHGLMPCASAIGSRITDDVSAPAVTGNASRSVRVTTRLTAMKTAMFPRTKSKLCSMTRASAACRPR